MLDDTSGSVIYGDRQSAHAHASQRRICTVPPRAHGTRLTGRHLPQMGICAEKCAKDYSISRDDQDAHVQETYRRTIAAIEQGHFSSQIAPVVIPAKTGNVTVTTDEEPLKVKIDEIICVCLHTYV